MDNYMNAFKSKLYQFVFELHDLVNIDPRVPAILMGIDYLLQVLFITFARILENRNFDPGFFLQVVDLDKFINIDIYKDEIDVTIHLFLTCTLFAVLGLIITTDEQKPRKQSDAWKLKFTLTVSQLLHSGLSMFIVTIHLINIQCPSPLPDFSCLGGDNVISPAFCVMTALINILNSYFLESIYNFQFISIRGQSGIMSNHKSFTFLPTILKYVAMGVYLSPLPDDLTNIYFVILTLVNIFQLYLKFNYSFNFSRSLSEVDVIGQAILCYNYILCVFISLLPYKVTNGDFILALLLNPVLGYIIWVLRRSSWNSKLYQNIKEIKSIQGQEIYIYRMLESIMEFGFEDQMILQGAIEQHQSICNYEKCFCRLSNLMENALDEEQKTLIAKDNLIKGCEKELVELFEARDGSNRSHHQRQIGDQISKRKELQSMGVFINKYVRYQGNYEKLRSINQLEILLILDNLVHQITNDQNRARMKIIQAYIQSYILNKDVQAMFILSQIQRGPEYQVHLQEKLAIFTYQKIIFDKLKERLITLTPESLSMEAIQRQIQFEQEQQTFHQHIFSAILKIQNLWDLLLKQHQYTAEMQKQRLSLRKSIIATSSILQRNTSDNSHEGQKFMPEIDYQNFYKLLVDMIFDSHNVEVSYIKLRKLIPEHLSVLMEYELFLRLFINSEYESGKLQQEIYSITAKRQIIRSSTYNTIKKADIIFNETKSLAVLIVQANFGNIGMIEQANQSFINLSETNGLRLKNHNIGCILPEMIDQQTHDKFIEKFLVGKSQSNFINQTHIMWIKKPNGFIIPVYIFIQPFFDRKRGLQFIAYFKKVKKIKFDGCKNKATMKDFITIVADQNGTIVNCSERFGFINGILTQKELKYLELNLSHLSQDLYEHTIELMLNKSHNPHHKSKDKKIKIRLKSLGHSHDMQNENILQHRQSFEQYTNYESSVFLDQKTIFNESPQSRLSANSFSSSQEATQIMTKFNRKETLFSDPKDMNQPALARIDSRFFWHSQQMQFQVIYISLDQDRGSSIDFHLNNDSQIDSLQKYHLKELQKYEEQKNQSVSINESYAQSQSMSSNTSNSNAQLQLLKNIKEEVSNQAKPHAVSTLQRYLLCFMIAFISLSLALLILAIRENSSALLKQEIMLKLKEVYGDLIQLKNEFRDLVLTANGYFDNQISFVPNKNMYLRVSLKNGLENLQDIGNKLKLQTEVQDFDLSNQADIQMYLLDNIGEILVQQSTLFQSLNQIYNKIFPYLDMQQSNLQCNGCLLRSQNHYQYSSQQLYQDLYFVTVNSVHQLGQKFWQESQIMKQALVDDEQYVKTLLIYLMVPGIVMSIFGGIYIMLIILKLISNKKKILQVIIKIKEHTVQKAINNAIKGETEFQRMIFGKVLIEIQQNQSSQNSQTLSPDQINRQVTKKESIQQEQERTLRDFETFQIPGQSQNFQSENDQVEKCQKLGAQDDFTFYFIKKVRILDERVQNSRENSVAINQSDVSMRSIDQFEWEKPQSKAISAVSQVKKENFRTKLEKKRHKAMIHDKIQNSLQQDRLKLVMRLLPVTLVFCSFFLTLFLLSYSMLDKLEKGFEVIDIITERDNCLPLTLSYVMDDLTQNKTSNHIGYQKQSLQGLMDYCTSKQSETQRLIKDQALSTFQIQDLLLDMDSSKLCQTIEMEIASFYSLNLLTQKCEDALNGLIGQGVTQMYTFIQKKYQDSLLQFRSINKTNSSLNALMRRSDFQIAQLSFSVFIRQGLTVYRNQIHNKLNQYFDTQYIQLLTVFLIFIGIILIMLSFLLFYVVKFVRKEIFVHKRIIKFTPICELERKSMSALLKSFDY